MLAWSWSPVSFGMRSLEDDAELVAGENAIPFDMAHVARGARAVMLHEFIRRRKALPGTDADRAGGRPFALRPGGEKPAEIEQRVADGGELPVDDGGEFRPVMAEHDIGEMIIAMDDAGLERGRAIVLQPFRDLRDAGNAFRTWP